MQITLQTRKQNSELYQATKAERSHHREARLITEEQNTELITFAGYNYVSWYSSMRCLLLHSTEKLFNC